MASNVLETIGKLLRQAEGKGVTDEEAALYMRKAQSLATTNQVDLALARQATAKREDREKPVQKSIYWGDLGTKNTKAHLVNLFSTVAAQNDVKLNIYHDSRGVIAFGFPSDIELVEALFGSLAVQMVEAGNAFIKAGTYKQEQAYREVRTQDAWGWATTDWVLKPVDGRTARASFYQGFASKISSRLREARREAAEVEVEVVVEDESGETHTEVSTGALVLASKAVEVRDYYSSTSKARGSWKGSSSSSSSNAGHNAGRTAGSNARLSSAKAIA